MSATKITDLLPIPNNVSQPHAYQVFGLEGGEQDVEKVTEAMRKVYAHLKESKPSCDPKIWTQAAKLAEAARKILEDPSRRRELDARFGVVSVDEVVATSQPVGDPLADMLPKADPTTAPANAVLGLPPLGTPPTTPSGGAAPAAASAPTPVSGLPPAPNAPTTAPETPSVGNWSPAKPTKKRKKSKAGVLLFGAFVVVMLGAIIAVVQFQSSKGPVVINATEDPGGKVVSDPMDVNNRPRAEMEPKPKDGVLDDVPASGVARGPSESSGLAEANPLDPNAITVDPMPVTKDVKPDPPEMPDPEPQPEPEPEAPSEAMLAANQQKIEAVEQMIRDANWSKMKSAAEALEKNTLSPQQSQRAGTLYDLADLASFYRGAIERGLEGLQTGATFMLTNDVPVIVVESSKSDLTIMFDKKQLSFTVDTLPPRLMQSLAATKLSPDKPDAIAGLALYRLIHPNTNAEYRELALEQLDSVDGQLESVDTAQLRRVVRELLQP